MTTSPSSDTGRTRFRRRAKLRQRLREPFAARLTAVAGTLIVITWGLLGVDFWIEDVRRAAVAREQAAIFARTIDERVARTLHVADQLLKVVGAELEERKSWSDARAVTHILRRLDPQLDQILSIAFVNAQGLSVGHSNPRLPVGLNFRDRGYFRTHVAAPDVGLFVDRPLVGQASGQRVFTASRRISSADGSFLGVLVAIIRTDALAADFANLTIGRKGAASLIHIPSRSIVVRQPDYQGTFGKVLQDNELPEKMAPAPQEFFSVGAALDGEERIAAYRRLRGLPLTVSVELSTSEIRANLLRDFAGYLTMAIMLSVLIACGAIAILAAHRREVGLKESTRRWQQIFEHAGWGMAVSSADGNTLEHMNPAYARMHGYSVEELTGQALETVYAPAARKDLPAVIARILKEGGYRFESLHVHQDGHTFPVLIDASLVRDKAGAALYRVVNVQDISEIRRVQDEMRNAREFFQHTFDAAPVGMAIIDADGRYTRVNRAMCELTGYAESEMLAMTYAEITHPDDVGHKIWPRQARPEDKVQSFQIEKRYVRKDGRVIWTMLVFLRITDAEGRTLYSMEQVLDIDSLKRAEQALRISEERFRGIFENANTGIAATDKHGHLLYFNEAFRAMLGYDAETLKQLHTSEISLPEDIAAESVLFDEILNGQRDTYRLDKRYVSRDGRIYWVDLYVSTIRDEHNDIVAFIGVISDISKRKEFALALAESRRKLRSLAAHQEEMLELERKHIAREVHDELGQLLTALKMDISVVRLRFGENLELLTMVEEMRALVERTITVVRQVASNLRPAALDHGLLPAIEWLAEDFAKRWSICCVVEAGSGNIVLEEMQSTAIFRVVQESLTNVARHASARKIVISLCQCGRRLLVVVKDDGQGFDMAAVRKGRGFGLFGMRERVRALGGRLTIDSAPGRGTAVSIDLPLLNSELS